MRALRSPQARSHVDAATTHIDVGTGASITDLVSFSVLCWVYPTSVANTVRNIVGKTVLKGGWELFKRGTNGTIMRLDRGRLTTAGSVASVSGTLTVNEWQMIAVTFDDVSLALCKMYRATELSGPVDVTDAAATLIGSGAPNTDAATSLKLFTSAAPTNGWPGAIAAIGVWDRVLSAGQIADAWRRPWHQLAPVGLWLPGSEGQTGNLVIDHSGHGNHGTYSSSTSFSPFAAPRAPLRRPTPLSRVLG